MRAILLKGYKRRRKTRFCFTILGKKAVITRRQIDSPTKQISFELEIDGEPVPRVPAPVEPER